MADLQLQFKRGNTAKNDAYTGLAGEITVDTQLNTLRIHDGSTAGGSLLAGNATQTMVWDAAVVSALGTHAEGASALGTHAEGASVNVSMQAHSTFDDNLIVYTTSGTLPPGLSLNTTNKSAVVLSGTLSNLGATATFTFVIQATDNYSTLSREFTLTVSATNQVPVWTTASSLGTFNASVSVQLSATDPEGTALTYTKDSGTLPAGVTLSTTGLLSGSVTNDGLTYNFTASVSDGVNPVSRTFSLALVSNLPGSSTLVGDGTATLGFYGEVSTAELITGDALASQIGLSAGTSQFSTEPWLKYSYNGQVRYVAKKPYRYNLSWEHIYQAGAVWGDDTVGLNPSGTAVTQNRTVTIAGKTYRVALMSGGNANPTANTTGYDCTAGVGSEWNKLFYRLHGTTHLEPSNTTASEGTFTRWANYSDAELHMHYSVGNGTYCWVKETHGASSAYRVLRGTSGVSHLDCPTATSVYTHCGWRPLLIPV